MDRRSIKRRHLIYYLRLFDQNSGALVGHLVDITPQGMMLISEQPIAVGVIYQLKMALPFEIGGKTELLLTARAIHCRQDVNPLFYATGFQLIGMEDPEAVETINQMINEFGFND